MEGRSWSSNPPSSCASSPCSYRRGAPTSSATMACSGPPANGGLRSSRKPVHHQGVTPPAAVEPPPESRPGRPGGADSRVPWAELLLRAFREDVLLCPCGGRRVVLA